MEQDIIIFKTCTKLSWQEIFSREKMLIKTFLKNHLIKGNFGIFEKPNKLLTGNWQLNGADTELYSYY